MFFLMVQRSGHNFLSFCHKSRVWQTYRRTDRQLSHVCNACSAKCDV